MTMSLICLYHLEFTNILSLDMDTKVGIGTV